MGVWAGVVTKDQHTHKKRGGERRCVHLPWKETKTMLADVLGRMSSDSASFAPVRHCKCEATPDRKNERPSCPRVTSVIPAVQKRAVPQKQKAAPGGAAFQIQVFRGQKITR